MPSKLKNGVTGAMGGKRANAGRPPDWLKAECQKAGPNIIRFLVSVANGEAQEQVVNGEGETIAVPASVKDRIKAAEVVLDRGFGKVNQPLTGENGEALTVQIVSFSKPA